MKYRNDKKDSLIRILNDIIHDLENNYLKFGNELTQEINTKVTEFEKILKEFKNQNRQITSWRTTSEKKSELRESNETRLKTLNKLYKKLSELDKIYQEVVGSKPSKGVSELENPSELRVN